MLLQLPTELLCSIPKHLESERDINALVRTNRQLHNILNSYLYQHNARWNGSSALHWAARKGRVSTACIALDEGARADRPEWRAGKTALALAAENGHVEMVEFLLERNDVDPNSRSDGSLTPLALAAMNGWEDVVRTLLASPRVMPNPLAKGGYTPVLFVVEKLFSEISIYDQDAVKPYKLVVSHFLAHPRFSFDPFCRLVQDWRDRQGSEGVYEALSALGMDPYAKISAKDKSRK